MTDQRPTRLRLSRATGFDLQALSLEANGLPAISVARPGKWGNPFIVGKHGDREYCVRLFSHLADGMVPMSIRNVDYDALLMLQCSLMSSAALDELRGHNLACWCSLDGPCHADVLLAIANQPTNPQANGEQNEQGNR